MSIRANPRHTFIPLLGVAFAAILLWVREPSEAKETNYYTNKGAVFGTYYTIRYEATEDLEPVIKEALQQFDNSLSMFNPHSILSAINANRDTMTNATVEAMFAEAQRVYAWSNGAFDITVAPLVNYWGFGKKEPNSNPSFQRRELSKDIDSILQLVGMDKVQLVNHRIIKADPRVQLDAGAVAKGQSCDMVAAVLREHGCTNYLVEIGGEVVLKGVNARGEPWSVGISKPNINNQGTQTDYQTILHLTDACIATSGNYRNYHAQTEEADSPLIGHTIDPRTGMPKQQSVLSATIISSSCMRSDALATACMVLGQEEALAMIAQIEDAACMLIVRQGDSLTVVNSPNWKEKSTK